MGLGNTWHRYLTWRRDLKGRAKAIPAWEPGKRPLVGLLQSPEPVLRDGEVPVLASLSSASRGWWGIFQRGEGALWLTSQRLIFQHQRMRMPFAPAVIEIPRPEIESVCKRSMFRSILGSPFMRAIEVKTVDQETYIFQVMGAQRWVTELEGTVSNQPEG